MTVSYDPDFIRSQAEFHPWKKKKEAWKDSSTYTGFKTEHRAHSWFQKLEIRFRVKNIHWTPKIFQWYDSFIKIWVALGDFESGSSHWKWADGDNSNLDHFLAGPRCARTVLTSSRHHLVRWCLPPDYWKHVQSLFRSCGEYPWLELVFLQKKIL